MMVGRLWNVDRSWLVVVPLAVQLAMQAVPDAAQAAAQAPPRCVAIVGQNDVHGAIEPYDVASQGGLLHAEAGGTLVASGYVANLRRAYGARTLVLDAGDIFQGTMASNLSHGEAMVAAYNAMQVDAATIGNHEFDFGALPGQDEGLAANRLGVLQARIAEAQFPFLTVNIFDRATHRPIAWKNVAGSVLRDVGGIKVGILGAATPGTPQSTRAQNVETLAFLPPAPKVLEEARRLRAAGAELVVLIAHMGGRCGTPRELHEAQQAGRVTPCDGGGGSDAELTALVQALPAGTLDVAIGGHTHQFIAHWINGVATLESGAQGHYIGWVEACVQPGGQGIDADQSAIHGAIPLCLQTWDDGSCRPGADTTAVHPARFLELPVVPMPEVQQAVAPFVAHVAAQAHRPCGVRLAEVVRAGPLTTWAAEAMRRAAHADFGLQTRGGIRNDLPAGELVYADVFLAMPFDGFVTRVHITGQQLRRLVLHLVRQKVSPSATPNFVGLKVESTPAGLDVVDDRGLPLVDDRVYTLSTNDFLAQGGDGTHAVLREVPAERIHITPIGEREALIHYLAEVYPSKA